MKKRVIVVDDNPDLLYTIKQGIELTSDDYEIEGVLNAKDCFERMKSDIIPDLILLDIMMPKINGWDVLAKIRSDPKWNSVPVIFLTAKNDDISKGLGKLTSDGYVTKPFNVKELINKINEILGG